MSDFDLYVFEEGQAEQQALREAAQAAHEAQAAGPQPSAEDLPHSEYVPEPLPEPKIEPGPDFAGEAVSYSRGRDKFHAYPEQRTAASFEAFAEAVLADRSSAKGLAWISAPFKPNNDGQHHRCGDGALPRRFLAFDLDGATPDAFVELCMKLGEYSGFGYTTASHTGESPHARYILELSRPVDRAEGIRLGQAMQQRIEARLSLGIVKLDSSVYRADQPISGRSKTPT